MDIDSSIQNKPQTAEKMHFHLSDISPYHSTSESSDLEFSGGSSATFTAAATPSPPYQETRLPLFLQNVECSFPCTSLSLMQGRDQSMEAMRETIFRMAVMQPVHMEPSESSKPPKRKNVRISKDPQSVAARHRRERISHRIRTLQRMVPGGTKLDTASMLDEAVHYLKFLKKELQSLEEAAESNSPARIQSCWSFSGGINFANA